MNLHQAVYVLLESSSFPLLVGSGDNGMSIPVGTPLLPEATLFSMRKLLDRHTDRYRFAKAMV